MRHHPAVALLAAIGLFSSMPAAHSSPSFLKISGIVNDPSGRALQGVTVSDGDQSSLTDANGYYSIQEVQFGTYFITAGRAGLTSATAVVTLTALSPNANQDFELKYTSTLAVDAIYRSTAAGTATVTATLETHAPDPGTAGTPGTSCASITDTRTSLTTSMTHSGSNGNRTVWTATTTLPLASPEGTFTLTGKVTDCGSDTQIDTGAGAQYVIDNTPPGIDAASLTPGDLANTMFAAQPLLARIVDAGPAGVDPASLKFQLSDQEANTTIEYRGPEVRYDPATGWGRTQAPLVLMPSHNYTALVSVADRAGNATAPTWTFRSIAIDFAMANVAIDTPGIRTGQAGAGPTTEQWRFFPQLAIEASAGSFNHGSMHSGWGTLSSRVPLGTASISVVIDGQTQEWPIRPYAVEETRDVLHQFSYTLPSGLPRTTRVVGTTVWLPEILIDLPITATDATLALATSTLQVVPAGVCPDPTAGPPGCSPDPLRVHINSRLAERIHQPPATVTSTLPVDDSFLWNIHRLVPDPIDSGGIWRPLTPPKPNCGRGFGDPAGRELCLIEGVLYEVSSSTLPPASFEAFCAQTLFCTAQGAQSVNDYKFQCVDRFTGRDRPPFCGAQGCVGAGSEKCQQQVGMSSQRTRTFLSKSTDRPNDLYHEFRVDVVTDFGFQDGPYDDLGLHWSTEKKDMRWKIARAADIEGMGYLDNAAVLTTYDPHWGGVYPKCAPDWHACEYADEVTSRCFAQPRLYKVYSDRREHSDNSGVATGIGPGSASDPAGAGVGWRQWQRLDACYEGGQAAYLRAETATLIGVFAQSDFVGAGRRDGFLLATYGHMERQFNFNWDFVWDVAVCAIKKGWGCNPLGLIFKGIGEDEAKRQVRRQEHAMAFSYS